MKNLQIVEGTISLTYRGKTLKFHSEPHPNISTETIETFKKMKKHLSSAELEGKCYDLYRHEELYVLVTTDGIHHLV